MNKFLISSFILASSFSLSAQVIPSVKVDEIKNVGKEVVSKENTNLDKQIKTALMKDEGLQKNAINYLKSNPDTSKSLAGLLMKNDGSSSAIMKSILGDDKLTAVVIDYITKNPKLLKQATSLIGM